MSSEPPPNDNETTSFPLSSPPRPICNNLHNIRPVLQSQDSTVSQSRTVFSPNTQLDLLLRATEQCNNIEPQTPMREVSTVATTDTPIHKSPSKEARLESVRTLLYSQDPEQKALSIAKRKRLVATTKRSSRNYGNPQDCILWFLRHERLAATALSLKLPVDFKIEYRSLASAWHSKPDRLSYAPFNKLKDALNNGSTALSHRHSRLILEDVLVLHPGEMVVCLISRKHPFFVKSAIKKQWIGKLEKAIRNNPLKPVVINKVIFFPFNLRIRSNPNGNVLTAGLRSG